MIISLSIVAALLLLFWFGEYMQGRYGSGCNARISFKLFKHMHQKFPGKWCLYSEYVAFYYEDPRNATYKECHPTKEFRGYFGFLDLPRYWLYQSNYTSEIKRQRELKDYTDVLRAFDDLEKRIQE